MGDWKKDLQEMADAFDGEGFEAAFQAVDQAISEGFEENFYNQLDHDSVFWKPRKDRLPHPLLIKTKLMFNAATDPQHPGHKYEHVGDTVTIGIKDDIVPYAKYHHFGTRKMPARRVIYATQQTINRAMEVFADAIEGKLLS